MILEDISSYFRSTKHQRLNIILTILLPLVSGVIILIAANPALATESSVSNLCLLGVVAVLPIWFLNLTIWSILGAQLIRDIVKRGIDLTEIPDEGKAFLTSMVHESLFLSMSFGMDVFKYVASVVTMVACYAGAGIAYFTKTHLLTEYIVVVILSIAAVLLWKLYSPKVVAKIKAQDLKPIWEKVISDEDFRQHVIQRLNKIQQIIIDKKNAEEKADKDID